MKVYIAASFVAQKRLRTVREQLFKLGHNVIGSWLDEITKPTDMPQAVFNKKLAIKDLQEIREADCLIVDTTEPSTTGGRMVELGSALNQMKLLYHVGQHNSNKDCIFLNLVDKRFDTWEELFEFFQTEHITTPYVAAGMEDKEFTTTAVMEHSQFFGKVK